MWMKLSDMAWPEDHAALEGQECVVAHVNSKGEIYEGPRVARFNMEQGLFIAEDDTGPHAINPGVSGGEVYFLALPPLEVGGKLLC